MSFWGTALKPGQREKVEVPEAEVLHLSQVCLHDPKAGKSYLQVGVDGTTYTFCCLEKDKVEHQTLDLFFGPTAPTFVNKGTSEVHLSGYFEPMDEDGGDSEEEEEEEEISAPAKSSSPKAAAKASPKVEPKKASPKAEPKASPKASPKAAAAAKAMATEEESEDEEGEEEEADEGEESEEIEQSEEEEGPAAKKKAALAELAKRKAADQQGKKGAAEPPAKKAKAEASPKAAVPASPKGGAPSKDAEYVKDLIEFLKKNGKTKMSDLGSKVKRPAGCQKMRLVLDSNKDKFSVAGDAVELKK